MGKMRTILLNMWCHLCCLQRLVWVQSPSFWMRLRTFVEYVHLSRIQRQIMRRGGLQEALARLLAPSAVPRRSADMEDVRQLLYPLRPARWAHPTAQCVARSLRILEILRAAGLSDNACLKVGIRRAAVGFRGHAWVDYNGKTLLEEPILEDEYDFIWKGTELLQGAGAPSPQAGAYRVKEGVLVQPIAADEAVLLDIAGGVCFGLNGSSYLIWQEIAQTGAVEGSIQKIAAETGVDSRVVCSDVEEFLDAMKDAGLVRAA